MEYVITRHLDEFEVAIEDLAEELGGRFSVSIANWCGVGARPYPLPVWVVYLVKSEPMYGGEVVGVCSYYQQVDDPADRFWIGWIGVRRKFRRQGRARLMLARVREEVRLLGAKKVCVYTSNPAAVALYESFGMSIDGKFSSTGLQQAAANGEEVLLSMPL